MNDPSTWTPCVLERPQPLDELVAVEVEALVDVLQSFGGDRLDADERAFDARLRIARGTPDLRPPPW